MSTGPHIRAVGDKVSDEDHAPGDDTLELDQPIDDEATWLEPVEAGPGTVRRKLDYVWPGIFAVAILAWTGVYGSVRQSEILAGASAEQWIGWITQWAIPVLLVITVWLLTMRLSRREATRFGDAAAALSEQSRVLEDRLSIVNRELSLAREFLADQSRELDFLGRTATDRLSSHADTLQGLIRDNGAQLDAIALVSTTAMENMGRLRDNLPVIANSARDVTNRIGGAGREAQSQLDDLLAGFQRLDEVAQSSEERVAVLLRQVDQALDAFGRQASQLEEIADTRFALLREKSDEFRTTLDGREVETLAAMRHRAARLADEIDVARAALESEEEEALKSLRARMHGLREEAATVSRAVRDGEASAVNAWSGQIEAIRARLVEAIEEIQRIDALAIESAQAKMTGLRKEAEDIDAKLTERNAVFATELEKRQRVFAQDEARALQTLTDRLSQLDDAIAQRRAEQVEKAQALTEESEGLAARVEALGNVLDGMAERASEVDSQLAGSTERLHAQLDESRNAIGEARDALAELTEASVRMLELIHAGSQHSKGELVQSIEEAERHLQKLEDRGSSLRVMLEGSEQHGKNLSDYVIRARDVTEEAAEHIGKLHEDFGNRTRGHIHELGKLQEKLVEIGNESELQAGRSRSELQDAITQLENATRSVASTLSETSLESVTKLAESVGRLSAEAVDRALSEHTRQSIAELESAATKASGVSREAAAQLRNQLAKVDELAGNLESRVSRAREQAEERAGHDFARRMALITESLNSNAIDIARAISSEVPDTTWASYLRGDRGIFTRRAVRLIDNVEARDIAELYDSDAEFRDQVSRYVADFETMLRSILSTRDGNTLGVTLLGSDMGKLYVALAQAIERLRN